MKLKETQPETNETINSSIDVNNLHNAGMVDVDMKMNSNVSINQFNQDGLDGYYNPVNASVGISGFFDMPPEEPQRRLTKEEFVAREGNRKHRDRITISSIVIYVAAIIGIFAADFLVKTIENMNGMIEALGGEPYDVSGYMSSQIFVSIVMICLGIGIQLFKSRICAIIGLVGSGINVIATFIMYHKFGGYYVFLAFCYATAATFALSSRWKEYESTGKCRGVI